jgi:hypothetical protein
LVVWLDFSGLKRKVPISFGVDRMNKIVFAKRVEKLPADLQTALMGDLKATIEERLANFERIAQRREKKSKTN